MFDHHTETQRSAETCLFVSVCLSLYSPRWDRQQVTPRQAVRQAPFALRDLASAPALTSHKLRLHTQILNYSRPVHTGAGTGAAPAFGLGSAAGFGAASAPAFGGLGGATGGFGAGTGAAFGGLGAGTGALGAPTGAFGGAGVSAFGAAAGTGSG